MKTQELLSRLEKVSEKAPGRWVACCPAHQDRIPSLAITEAQDRVLIHCFGGCSVFDVVQAVGMELTDLFPPIDHHVQESMKTPFNARQVLSCLGMEISVMAVIVGDIKRGEYDLEQGEERLNLMLGRIRQALECCNAG